jgi:hypothetical protein
MTAADTHARESITLWERWIVMAGIMLATFWAAWCATLPQLPVNPASRFATMESLVERNTWSIDQASMRTIDKVQFEGRFYSSKPPLMAFIGAGVYYALHHWADLSFAEKKYPTVAAMNLPLSVLPWLLGCVVFVRLTHYLVRRSGVRIWAGLSFTFGTLPIAYAASLDNHTWSVTALLVSAWALLPLVASQESDSPTPSQLPIWRAALAGLAAGGAFTFDLGAGPIIGLVGLAVAWRMLLGGPRQTAPFAVFVLAGLAFPALQSGILLYMSGDFKPFYLRPDAYQYEGSYWRNPTEFDALHEPRWVYALHALVGHHGLFSHSPWLLLGAAWFFSRETSFRARILQWALAGSVLFIIGYYVARTNNYGGRCVGMRWFMVLTPVLALAAARYADRFDLFNRRTELLVGASTFSAIACTSGTVNPWEEGLILALLRGLGAGSVAG